MDFNNSPMSRHENPSSIRQVHSLQVGRRTDSMTKLTGTFYKYEHINSMWITVSFRDVFINDSTDGVQDSRLFSKMAYRAVIAIIPSAVSGSSYILV